MKNAKICLVAVTVLVIAMVSVGYGFAYTSSTSSNDNNFSPSIYITATDSNGDPNIQIPTVNYYRSGSVWAPSPTTSSLNINLDVGDAQYIRMFVEFENPMSWMVIKELSIYVDDVKYVCSSNVSYINGTTMTESVPISEGNHTYRIAAVYNEQLSIDPAEFTGQNMASKIVFLTWDS